MWKFCTDCGMPMDFAAPGLMYEAEWYCPAGHPTTEQKAAKAYGEQVKEKQRQDRAIRDARVGHLWPFDRWQNFWDDLGDLEAIPILISLLLFPFSIAFWFGLAAIFAVWTSVEWLVVMSWRLSKRVRSHNSIPQGRLS